MSPERIISNFRERRLGPPTGEERIQVVVGSQKE